MSPLPRMAVGLFNLTKNSHIRGPAKPVMRGDVARTVQSLNPTSSGDLESERSRSVEPGFLINDAVSVAFEEWQERASHVPRELLSEPVWGMLLELLMAETQGRRASFSSIRKASGVPDSTTNRWLKALELHAWVVRRTGATDPHDDSVSLSRKGSSALRRYFHQVVQRRERRNSYPDVWPR